MNNKEVQKILRALDACCEQKSNFFSAISTQTDDWLENIENCCESYSDSLDEIIDILEDWAAEYSATWSEYLCQEEDNEIIGYDISFSNYLCRQILLTTTTSTSTTTTTTTVDPTLRQFEIVFSDYLCVQEDDPTATTTTTFPLKSGVIEFSAAWGDFLCGMEDNPSVTTTTTTAGITTTTTTVNPEDVTFSATWDDYLCKMDDNPLLTTTTTSTTINEDDVAWQIIFENYLCQQIPTVTTTTSEGTTTTTAPATTTTTTISDLCPVAKSGGTGYPLEYNINIGATIGVVTLTVDVENAPDRFVVEWNGSQVIDTGYRGDSNYQDALYKALIAQGASMSLISGTGTGSFTFNKTTSDPIAKVKVYAPLSETDWSFTLGCPVASPVVTTTTTTLGIEYTGEHVDYLCQLEDDPSVITTTTTSTSTTTMPVTTTTTTIGEYEITCGQQASGETVFPLEVYIVDMGAGTGYVTLTYDAENEPDKFIVEIDGLEVLNTGYRGDPALQDVLDAELTSRGLPTETIQGIGTGTAQFYKASSTTIAIVKVYAPLPETKWSFAVACPDGATTTTTSTSTTTVITTTTTTATPITTTTTTNAVPVSSDNSLSNRSIGNCGEVLIMTPSDFTFTDAESDVLRFVRIDEINITGSGSLTYDGNTVVVGDKLKVFGGSVGSFQKVLEYTPDSGEGLAYEDTVGFSVSTINDTGSFSNTSTLTINNAICVTPSACATEFSYTSTSPEYPHVEYVELGATNGDVDFYYYASNNPDLFMVYYNDGTVINTGYVGNVTQFGIGGTFRNYFNSKLAGLEDPVNGGTYPSDPLIDGIESDGYPEVTNGTVGITTAFTKIEATNTVATVKVYSPINTVFEFTLGCPVPTTTTTTTTTTV